MQHKPDFKKMTDSERKAFLKTVPKRTSAAPAKKVSYLQLNKTARPITVSAEFDDKFNNSMKRYRNHINQMVTLGFSDPVEPTFRNDVVSNMKEFYSNNPKELIPMHNKEWIVDDIVAKMVKKHMKESAKTPGQTSRPAVMPKKTKAVLEARRRQKKVTAAASKPRVSPNKSNSNNNNNNNIKMNNNGFNMNMSNNNNNNNAKSNKSNNNNSNKNSTMSNNDVKKLMNNLKKLNMSVLRV